MRKPVLATLIVAPTVAVALLASAWWWNGHRGAPYAGLDQREIKALAPERIAGLREGDGLGYALPAELNDVPGPKHVLQLDRDLDLTPTQRSAVEAIFDRMNAKARELGTQLIEAERALDAAFAGGGATAETVAELTAAASAIEGRLRAAHLTAHIETQPVLTASQRETYAAARGYGHHGHGAGH